MKLPRHEAGLILEHNPHKAYYISAEEYVEDWYRPDGQLQWHEWLSEEDYQQCIETDDLWVLQWYPRTPVGFHKVFGSSLEIVLQVANEIDRTE